MIYSPYAGPSYPLFGWTTSAAYLEGNTFDQCGGHSSSTTSPSYHYHVAPSCLLKQLGMAAGQHSPQIGWMADGFPLYGPLGPNGVVMQTCTVTGGTAGSSVCLDACGGYLADTGDGFAYRYYMPGTFNSGQCNEMPAPAPVGGGANYYPQSPTCLRGCCPSGVTCSMGSVNLPTCATAATTGTTATFVARTASALPINSAAVNSASSAAAARSTLCCSSSNIASVSTSPTPTQACSTLGHCAVDDCVYNSSTGASSASTGTRNTPPPPPGGTQDPCFPSTATVTKADGSAASIASLKEGDVIVAAAADGTLTTDTVSLLSIAKPEMMATFIRLKTAEAYSLELTEEHHVPVGAACCSTLKQAKEIAVGETVWTVSGGATVATTVTEVSRTANKGLHSPVLAAGSFPIVEGFVTSFDGSQSVMLASYGLTALLRACKATGTCAVVQSGFAALWGRSTADFIA